VSQARIDAYVVRASLGSAKKNIRHVGDGVYKIKIDYGPGYRVYFAVPESQILLLLLGGSKRGQDRDIRTAKQYWRNYLEKNTNL
jgi:putative addiction module killer protein